MNEYKKIMVGIDGSKQAKLALEQAIDVAKQYNAELLIVTVQDDGRFAPLVTGSAVSYAMDADIIQGIRDKVKENMVAATQLAEEAGISYRSKIYYGNAKEELAKTLPESENIDLIVMGATGLNRFERMMIGSNSNYVLQHAPCDVMIVRE